ncbi:RagB/SusD family nutrient uptake outer membrane protein [Ornithobacterium rhinotracheale]|uniref:RagB/SusD family nutrient uptake outer membrane protein n=1 Tax=Ornithobacterium rhinotracheale TaxID=28251 RepID=UPI003FA426AA
MKKLLITLSLISSFAMISCDDYLDIQPKDRVIPSTLQEYRELLTSGYNAFPNDKSKTSVRTDELEINPKDFSANNYKDIFLWNDRDYDAETSEFSYDLLYRSIFYTNEVINHVGKLQSNEEQKQLLAEAHALRAYTYFELVNLFAKPYNAQNTEEKGVPIVLATDLEKEKRPESIAKIYALIEDDLAKAESLMQIEKADGKTPYRFSKISLNALISRVALYKGEWQKSIDYANKVLAKNSNLLDLNKNEDNILPNQVSSPENIMALDYAIDSKVRQLAFVSKDLLNLYDQKDDLRFSLYYAPVKDSDKYQTVKGNNIDFKCSFRIGEIMLVKAEALLKLKQEGEAKEVLNQLAKTRYNAEGLKKFSEKLNSLNGENLWTEFMNERQREVAFEGYRWFDLRRNDQKEIKHTYNDVERILQKNDPRYTIAFPKSARQENPFLQ